MPINIICRTYEQSKKITCICDEERELSGQIEVQERQPLMNEVGLTVSIY